MRICNFVAHVVKPLLPQLGLQVKSPNWPGTSSRKLTNHPAATQNSCLTISMEDTAQARSVAAQFRFRPVLDTDLTKTHRTVVSKYLSTAALWCLLLACLSKVHDLQSCLRFNPIRREARVATAKKHALQPTPMATCALVVITLQKRPSDPKETPLPLQK